MQRHEEEGGIVFYWLLFSKDHLKIQKSTKIARNLWYQTEELCRKEKKGLGERAIFGSLLIYSSTLDQEPVGFISHTFRRSYHYFLPLPCLDATRNNLYSPSTATWSPHLPDSTTPIIPSLSASTLVSVVIADFSCPANPF